MPLLLLYCECCSFLLSCFLFYVNTWFSSVFYYYSVTTAVYSLFIIDRLQQQTVRIVTHHTHALFVYSIAGQQSETRVQVVNSSVEFMLHDDLIVVVIMLLLLLYVNKIEE